MQILIHGVIIEDGDTKLSRYLMVHAINKFMALIP